MTFLYFYIFIFLLGLAVGSFLNCIIYRLEKEESPLKGRSYCPKCKHQLSWQDLIPVFSFLILRGRCRYCQKSISWQYPLVEISTALLFILIFFYSQANILLSTFYFLLSSFLIIIFVYDLKHYIIPDRIVFPAIVLAFLYQVFKIWDFEFILDFGFRVLDLKPLLSAAVAAILVSGFFLSIFLISRGKAMGFGDVKLTFFMGLFLGFPDIIVALFLAFLLGAIIGVGLIIAGRKKLKSEVPFGPFLVAGTFAALFFGSQIVSWYLGVLII